MKGFSLILFFKLAHSVQLSKYTAYYRHDLSKIIKKLLTLGEVAELSNDVTQNQMNGKKSMFQRMSSVGRMVVDRLESDFGDMDDDATQVSGEAFVPKKSFSKPNPKVMTSAFIAGRSSTFMTAIYENLDEWEEPELQDKFESVSKDDYLHSGRSPDIG